MTQPKRITLFSFTFLLSIILIPVSHAQQPATEMVLFEEVPMVFTASKMLEPATEAPASVYVVTQEDIKQTPSIHLWDSLRDVPGMDVVTSTIGQADVSLRGFADPTTNQTLLLLDGRSVLIPIQGFILWENMPIQLNEIDRIEVVRGPVSSLYGANANQGLINVITKKPKQMLGTNFTAIGGTQGVADGSVIYAHEKNALSYKVSTGWKESNSFDDRGKDALDMKKFNMDTVYELGEDSNFEFSGGIAEGSHYLLATTSQISSLLYYGPEKMRASYVKSNYKNSNFEGQVYWNYWKGQFDSVAASSKSILHSLDTELRYRFETSEDHSFTIGGGSHFDNAKSTIFNTEDPYKAQVLYNIYLQDKLKLSDKWTLYASVRTDKYPRNGVIPSGRVAANYHLNPKDVIRASTSYSFRAPTLDRLYLDFPQTPALGITSTTFGDATLDPETYLTYEVNYEGQRLDNRLRPFANVFLTRIQKFIDPVGTGGGPFGLDTTFHKLGYAYLSGGEIGLKYDLANWINLTTDYAHLNIDYSDGNENRYYIPKRKVNFGLKMKFFNDRLSARIMNHYVSKTETNLGDSAKNPGYILTNLWIGYQPKKDMEVSVGCYNLAHQKHTQAYGADQIGTRILGKVELKF